MPRGRPDLSLYSVLGPAGLGPKSGSWSLVSSPPAGPKLVLVPGPRRVQSGLHSLVCSPWSAKGPGLRSASWSPALHTTNPLTYPKTGLSLAISGGLNQMFPAAALPLSSSFTDRERTKVISRICLRKISWLSGKNSSLMAIVYFKLSGENLI